MAKTYNKDIVNTVERVTGLDYYIIARDIAKEWLSILLLVIAAGLLTSVYYVRSYTPSYTTRSTMVVSSAGASGSIYNSIYSTSQTTTKFSQILNSSLLQKKVAEEIGLPYFVGKAEASNVENTNLLQIKVTTSSPEISFREMKSILENYGIVSQYLLGNVILETLEPPTVAKEADNPMNIWRPMFIAMAATGIIMIAFLAMMSVMRDTVRSAEDVERKLDGRLLESVAHENKNKSIRSRIGMQKRSILITDPTVTFRYVETIRRLARKTINRLDEAGARSLMITSVMENEGKSTTSINLAIAMAQEGKRVVLIDCDFRKPSLYKVAGYSNKEFNSLGDVYKNNEPIEELAVQLNGTKLDLVLNKVEFPDSTNMLSSGVLQKVISYFLAREDYVILDTSPMALVADAEEMASMVDATALVIRQHLVEAKYINDAIDALNAGNSKMIGCVLNDVHIRGTEPIRTYGQYYYNVDGGYGGVYEH